MNPYEVYGYGLCFEREPVTIDTTRNPQTGEFDGLNRFLTMLKECAPKVYQEMSGDTAGIVLRYFMEDDFAAIKAEVGEEFDGGDLFNLIVEFFVDNYTGSGGEVAPILAAVIEEAENIRLTCCTDEEGIHYLLLQPSFPWNNDAKEERALVSEEKFCDVLNTYVEKLTGKSIAELGITLGYYSVVEGN